MNKIKLSKRLLEIASLVKQDDIVLDVGSDHALLPIYLILSNKVKKAYASEINLGPYNSSIKNIEKYGVSDRVIPLLVDGLVKYSKEVNTIIITGMGPTLITNILSKRSDKELLNQRLILGPNLKPYLLRKWLVNNNFTITNELVVEDNKKYYELIEVRFTKVVEKLTEKEIYFGPILLKNRTKTFLNKWQTKLKKIQEIEKNIADKQSNSYKKNSKKIELIKEILN